MECENNYFEREDDYNVFEENQLLLDKEYDYSEDNCDCCKDIDYTLIYETEDEA